MRQGVFWNVIPKHTVLKTQNTKTQKDKQKDKNRKNIKNVLRMLS